MATHVVLCVFLLVCSACRGLRVPAHDASSRSAPATCRRDVISLGLAAATACAFPGASQASAADDQTVKVYFGAGCFWHVQHELIEAERQVLRWDADIKIE